MKFHVSDLKPVRGGFEMTAFISLSPLEESLAKKAVSEAFSIERDIKDREMKKEEDGAHEGS